MTKDSSKYITVGQFARNNKVSRSCLRHQINRGMYEGVFQDPTNGRWYIPADTTFKRINAVSPSRSLQSLLDRLQHALDRFETSLVKFDQRLEGVIK